MLSDADLIALWTTFRLAAVSTLILIIIGTPLAWWLAQTESRLKAPFEAIVALPIVLPPTVLGLYLLISLGPAGPIGELVQRFGGEPLAVTFTGLVIGSVFYSLPFVVQPLQTAFSAVNKSSLEVAATLRASALDRFCTVALPLSRQGFLTATVLGFAHTVGEFGVVLMIGGNIPGATRVVSIAIYDHVEAGNYASAHWLSGGLLLLSFALLFAVFTLNRRAVAVHP